MNPRLAVTLGVVILLLLSLSTLALRGSGDDVDVVDNTPSAAPAVTIPDAGVPTARTPQLPAGQPLGDVAPPSDQFSDPVAPPTDLTSDSDAVLPAGTCIMTISRTSNVGSVEPIDCQQEHSGEVFLSLVLTQPADVPYPGMDPLEADSRRVCEGQAFESYVGRPYVGEDLSRFFTYALLPTESSWAEGDRDVSCVLYDVAGFMTGSQRGSGL